MSQDAQPEPSSSDPAPLQRDPYWWVPAAVVIGFLAIANYVWLSFV